MKRVARILRYAFFALAAVALSAVLAAITGTLVPRPFAVVAPDDDLAPTRRILVLANPIHTDIALPVDPDVIERFGFLRDDGLPLELPGVDWIVAGWGGRAFYLETPTWSELKAGPLFSALTLDRAVMHMSLAGAIDPGIDGVLALDLTETEFNRLVDRVMATFRMTSGGLPELIPGRSYGEFDRFYEAHGYFNAVVGCNTWTGLVLRDAGIRTGWWNPLPQSLFWSIEMHNPERL